MKLWAMPCRATQDGRVMVESSDKTWSVHWRRERQTTSYSCLENPINGMKRQNDRKLKDELLRSVGAQYATGDQWRKNSRKNEKMVPKQKQHPVVDVTGDGSKVRCCKEQYCIGTWNIRSMNQGKLGVIIQEMARVNANILGISELKWTGMGEFNSDDHYIYYCGQESLRRNGVAIIVNKKFWNAVLGCSLKNDRVISVHFQGKPFNIMVIQVYALTSSAEEAEIEQFCKDLQDLLELTPKKDVLFIIGNWDTKVGSQETTGVTGKFGLGEDREAWRVAALGVAKSQTDWVTELNWTSNREGTQPRPSTENQIKDLLSMALPIRTRPSFPLSQSLPSGSFHKPYPSPIRGQTEWKPQSQKTNQPDHMDHSLD